MLITSSLLVYQNEESNAYPSPESSGVYRPHPNSGGKESVKPQNQVLAMILLAE